MSGRVEPHRTPVGEEEPRRRLHHLPSFGGGTVGARSRVLDGPWFLQIQWSGHVETHAQDDERTTGRGFAHTSHEARRFDR